MVENYKEEEIFDSIADFEESLQSTDDIKKYNIVKDLIKERFNKNTEIKIDRTKTENNNIYFITARLMKIDNCDTVDITKKTLNDIKYDELIIESDKLKICKEKNIDIFIEDSYDTCKELQLNGIKTYLMTTKMNEKIEDEEIERVKSWDELYLKINNYIGLLHNS